jgi:xanthine dehydrogenase large subunit
VSNTAFAFGGQNMLFAERMMDSSPSWWPQILDCEANFCARRDIGPYGQQIEDHHRQAGGQLGDQRISPPPPRDQRLQPGRFLKKGLSLTVKFGISFTLTHLNQAGALVHVYTDGSVHLNHGGTEMGQGLYVKVAQVVADVFGIGLDRVKITATTTDKVP